MADNDTEIAEESIELTEREIVIAQESLDEESSAEASEVDEVSPEGDEQDSEEEVAELGSEPESVSDPEPEVDEPAEEIKLTEADFELGESVGLSREDIEVLGSGKAVEKFAELTSKKTSPPEEPSEDSQDSKFLDISKINLEEYDDVTKAAFQAIDSLQGELKVIKKQRDDVLVGQEDAQLEVFNKSLDGLDADFYGESYKSGSGRMSDVGKEAMGRRMQLAESIDTLSAGYVSKGKEVPPIETLIEDAHKMTFKDRVSEVASKSKKGRLKKQASRRQSAGRQASKQAKSTGDPEEDEIARILRETEDAYNVMMEENGSR